MPIGIRLSLWTSRWALNLGRSLQNVLTGNDVGAAIGRRLIRGRARPHRTLARRPRSLVADSRIAVRLEGDSDRPRVAEPAQDVGTIRLDLHAQQRVCPGTATIDRRDWQASIGGAHGEAIAGPDHQ